MKERKIKRLLAGLLAVGMLGMNVYFSDISSMALPSASTGSAIEDKELTPEEKQQKEYEETIKKAYELPIQTNEIDGWPKAVGTYGDAAIVMDAESGAILYAKNIEKQEYPASITKLLTALLVYEYDAMSLNVDITAECQECLGLGYAHIGSDVGDILTMDQAMHAMLLASSNDIAYAIGDAVAKSQGEDYAWFIERMNQRCEELGSVNSNFLNTNGVFDENHYSCALDMALIGKELFKYPEFFELCKTQQYTIPASEHSEEHVFQQKHEMLLPGYKAYSENVIGGKTGYTSEAQNTLVTMADDGELQLVCVVLYEYPGYVYADTQALLDYGFHNFSRVNLSEHYDSEELAGLPETVYATLPAGISTDMLEKEIVENEHTAFVEYMYEGTKVSSYVVDARELENQKEVKAVLDEEAARQAALETQESTKQEMLNKIFKIVKIAAVVFVILIILLILYVRAEKERRRKERLRRRRQSLPQALQRQLRTQGARCLP